MLRSVETLDQWKYQLSDMIVSKKGSNEPMVIYAKDIESITIVHEYSSNIMPIILVKASVSIPIYQALTKHESDITVKLTIHKLISNSDAKARQLVMSKSFNILNQNDFQYDEIRNLDNNQEDTNGILGGTTNQLQLAEFYLHDATTEANYCKQMSISVQSNMTTLLAYAFGQRGFTHVFMNRIPGDFNSAYFVPVSTIYGTIAYLNERYGIFNTAPIFYMDTLTNRNYLLDKINLGKATDPAKPALVTLYIEEDGSTESTTTGSYNYNNTYVVNMVSKPNLLRIDSYSESIQGSTILAVDSSQQVTKVDGGKNTLQQSVFVMNSKIATQLSHNSKDLKNSFQTTLYDVDFDILQPNLMFKVGAHAKYQLVNPITGDYRLDRAVMSLNKSTETDMSLVADITLVKIVK